MSSLSEKRKAAVKSMMKESIYEAAIKILLKYGLAADLTTWKPQNSQQAVSCDGLQPRENCDVGWLISTA